MIADLLKSSPAWEAAIADMAAGHGAALVVRTQVSFAQVLKADQGFVGMKEVLEPLLHRLFRPH
ncbi:MAG: hypothetical protein RIB46_14250 [Pseudomonadales bacterium]